MGILQIIVLFNHFRFSTWIKSKENEFTATLNFVWEFWLILFEMITFFCEVNAKPVINIFLVSSLAYERITKILFFALNSCSPQLNLKFQSTKPTLWPYLNFDWCKTQILFLSHHMWLHVKSELPQVSELFQFSMNIVQYIYVYERIKKY